MVTPVRLIWNRLQQRQRAGRTCKFPAVAGANWYGDPIMWTVAGAWRVPEQPPEGAPTENNHVGSSSPWNCGSPGREKIHYRPFLVRFTSNKGYLPGWMDVMWKASEWQQLEARIYLDAYILKFARKLDVCSASDGNGLVYRDFRWRGADDGQAFHKNGILAYLKFYFTQEVQKCKSFAATMDEKRWKYRCRKNAYAYKLLNGKWKIKSGKSRNTFAYIMERCAR